AVVQQLPGEDAFVGRHIVGRLARDALARRGLEPAWERRDNGGGHFVLDREDVLELPVVALRPDVTIGFRVDQPHRSPPPVADLAHAAFAHVLAAKLARDLGTSTALPLYLNAELREMTNRCRKRDSSVRMSSVRPSAKNSCSASPLMLVKGSTTIEGPSA